MENVARAAQRFGTPLPGHPGGAEAPADFDIPRPPHWGGFRLWAEAVELWCEGDARMHDRARWQRALTPQPGATFRGGALVGDAPAALTPRSPGQVTRAVWKTVRISILLLILGVVALQQYFERAATHSWQDTLWVGVFPLNADGSRRGAALHRRP